ncbi:MAG: hypothetical protein NT099_05640, partial [Candidatus Saganbacteria bacterium]|nr:hypothetical protein [Candidatus Saganbacteria bacterium]
MGPSIFAKILSNPVEWLQSGRDRYRNKGISAADIRSGKVKFVTVKAKPDTVASHRTWEWMQYLVQQLADQGIEAEVLCPQLFLPAEGYVRGFYTAEGHKKVMPLILSHLLGKATKKVNVDGVEREVPDVSFPEAGLVSFVLVARTDKDLVGILRGSEKPAKEGGDGG